ncbi:MAG: hypothetical protein EAX81_07440 [Candidatus Thorarchaeota archaeon]|nr:hypothetical protein [Candidatus Thorarchaeota archaeon]
MISHVRLIGIIVVFSLIFAVLPLTDGLFIFHDNDSSQIRYSEPAAIEWSDDFEDGNYDEWTVNRGGYSATDGVMRGTYSSFNWAHHSSTTALGTWSFDFYFRGTNGMSVWFICNELVGADYNRPGEGMLQ